jgi:Family of unknown function (DUF6188)
VAYELRAILGRQAVLERRHDRYPHAHVVPLHLGWAIIPLGYALCRELGRARVPGVRDAAAAGQDSQRPLTAWLEELSRDDVVAYVEAEMHGAMVGGGGQDATVWRDGQIVFGPLHSSGQGAINQALRFMGIPADPAVGEGDEFATLGLGRHRKTEQWAEAEEARRGVAPRCQVWRWVERARPAAADRRPTVVRRLLALLARTTCRGTEAVSQLHVLERDGDWVLPVAGCILTQCHLAHAALLMILPKPGVTVSVSIEGLATLHRPAHPDVLLDPRADEEQVRPAFSLLGFAVKGAMAYASGRLELHFTDGSRLSVDPSVEAEAWAVHSSRGLRIVATPRGLAVWQEHQGR